MSSYLYSWNPNKWNWSDLQDAVYRVNNGYPYDVYWSCGNTKRIKLGDVFFLMRLGVEPKGIVGCGYVLSEPYQLPHWDEVKAAAGKTTLRTDLLFKALSETPIVSLDYLVDNYPNYNWTPQNGGQTIPDEIANEIFSLIRGDRLYDFEEPSLSEVQVYAEGRPKLVTYKTYDRSAAAKRACLEYHGYECSVCGFDFSKVYGDYGLHYIEVHHLKQMADIGEEYEIDPVQDLRPVCSNCHSMLHRKRQAISIEELKELISENKV